MKIGIINVGDKNITFMFLFQLLPKMNVMSSSWAGRTPEATWGI